MNAIVVRFSLVVGVMDALTGVALVSAPVTSLQLVHVGVPGGDEGAILLRWIGVFVAAVGGSYLWAIGASDPVAQSRRVPGVWGATAIARGAVAMFCGVAVITAQLPPVWLLVAGIDAVIACVQLIGSLRGWTRI